MITRAPATSANLGPAFDCAAAALDLWNELEVTEGEGVVVEGEGSGELPEDESNLAVRAFALLADPSGKRFRFVNRIPLERGLGSSAAAIALGLVAAAPNAPARELLRAGLRAREPRRQPRRRAARRDDARVGRRAGPDRADAPARAGRGGSARAHLDRGLARHAPDLGHARRRRLQRGAGSAPRRRRRFRGCRALRRRARQTRCTSRTARRRCSSAIRAEAPPGAAARRSPAPAPP